jgi:hypothetical protein
MNNQDQPVSVRVSTGLGRRAVLQTLLAGAGASVAVPALAHDHPVHASLQNPTKVGTADRKASAPGYKPQLLDKHLFDTLVVLSEAIVPGSTKAKVAEFIDALLVVELPATQRRFFNAMGALEGLAIATHRQPWKSLSASEQTALLTKASTTDPTPRGPGGPFGAGAPAAGAARATGINVRDQFDHLKGWIAGAYYSTEMGMKELGWNGTVFFAQLPACDPSA